MVCLPAVPWVKLSVSAGNRWPHNALRHHWLMPISCHCDCKALLVTSHITSHHHESVCSATASVQTFTFTYRYLWCFIAFKYFKTEAYYHHCKCWPWTPNLSRRYFENECCMLYSLLLYVVDLWTVVTLSTSWNANFIASFCAGLRNPISGVFRISVRGWGAVDDDRVKCWGEGWSPPHKNQNDKSGCILM